jgi:hypothetical protein
MASSKHPLQMLSANASSDARIKALERRLTGRLAEKADDRAPDIAVTPLKKPAAQQPTTAAAPNDPLALAARAAVKKRKTDVASGDITGAGRGLATGRPRSGAAADLFGLHDDGGSRGPPAAAHTPLQPASPFLAGDTTRTCCATAAAAAAAPSAQPQPCARPFRAIHRAPNAKHVMTPLPLTLRLDLSGASALRS